MNVPRGMLLLCAVLLAAGCSSVSVSHDFDSKADFASLRTYSWLTAPESTSESVKKELQTNSLIEVRVKKAVNQQLAAKGLKETTQDPDFLVAFHTGVQDKTDVQSWGYGYGYWGMRGGGCLHDPLPGRDPDPGFHRSQERQPHLARRWEEGGFRKNNA